MFFFVLSLSHSCSLSHTFTHTHTHTHIYIYIYNTNTKYIVFVSVMYCIRRPSGTRTSKAWAVNSQHEQQISLLSKAFRPALGPTQFPIRYVRGVYFPVVKRRVCEHGHSSASKADFKNACCVSLLTDVPS